MANSKLRVGLVGANPDYGWSPRAHVPALKSLSDTFALTAVCTAHPETAAAGAERFEVRHSFSDHPVEPNFDTGLKLHKLLAMIEKSSAEGQRIIL